MTDDWKTTNSTYGSFVKLPLSPPALSTACGSGSVRMYKACRTSNFTDVYVHLLVPSDAQVVHVEGSNKYRVSKAFVDRIVDKQNHFYSECRSFFHNGNKLTYKVGTMVYPDSFDSDSSVSCSNGVHCHLHKAECDIWFEYGK